MGNDPIDLVTLAAAAATALSLACTWPQVARVRRTGDVAGVSVTAAALTVSSAVGWMVYLAGEGLWTAVPEGIFNSAANTVLIGSLVRAGGARRTAVPAAVLWLAVLLGARLVGGPPALAALLALAYGVQLTPAVVTAWRTWSPTGLAAISWVLRCAEAVLWGTYGALRGDPPLITFAVLGVTASSAVLARTWVTRDRPRDPLASQTRLTMRWWGRSVSAVRNPSPDTVKPLPT